MENKMTTAQNINDKLFIMDYSWITESCLKQEGIFSMALRNFIVYTKESFRHTILIAMKSKVNFSFLFSESIWEWRLLILTSSMENSPS
jgi:hypothetical protein